MNAVSGFNSGEPHHHAHQSELMAEVRQNITGISSYRGQDKPAFEKSQIQLPKSGCPRWVSLPPQLMVFTKEPLRSKKAYELVNSHFFLTNNTSFNAWVSFLCGISKGTFEITNYTSFPNTERYDFYTMLKFKRAPIYELVEPISTHFLDRDTLSTMRGLCD